jgi:hypothetical protein
MSSPRGLVAGGMGEMGTGVASELGSDMLFGGVSERGGDVDRGGGRGKRKAKGLKGTLERSGGWRTFRYMLKARKALFACGTYLLMIFFRNGAEEDGGLVTD